MRSSIKGRSEEANRPAQTAHLTWALDDRYYELVELFGLDNARLIAQSHSDAIDAIERIVNEEKIDCDFKRVPGFLYNPPGKDYVLIDKELSTIQSLGMEISKVASCPAFETGAALCFPKQGQFHILKYLSGLIKAILANNGRIYSHSHVNFFEEGTPSWSRRNRDTRSAPNQ